MKVLIIVVALVCVANAIQILPTSNGLNQLIASIYGGGQQLISSPTFANSFNWMTGANGQGLQNCNYFPNLDELNDEDLRTVAIQINSWMCTCTKILVQLTRNIRFLFQGFPHSYRYPGLRYNGNYDSCEDEVEGGRLYVGSDSNKITVYSENDDGGFTMTTSFAAQSPYQIYMNQDGRDMYTISNSGDDNYNLTSYSMDTCGGSFHEGYAFNVHDDPEYLAVSPSGRYLLSTYSDDGYIYVDPLGTSDEQLTDAPNTYKSYGPFGKLQNSDPQQIVFDPSDPTVFGVSFKNLDVVQFYKFDDSDGTFQQLPNSAVLREDSGPTEFTFSKDNRFLFVCADYDMTVTAFLNTMVSSPNTMTNFTIMQVVSSLEPTQTRERGDYSVLSMHPSGNFLYVLNPHRSAIARIGVSTFSGLLSYLGVQATDDSNPLDMLITDDGTRLIVTNGDSNSVTVYSIDQGTGALTKASTISNIAKPTSLYYYNYGTGMNFDSSELGTNLDSSELGTNLDSSELGTNLDSSELD